MLCRVMSRFKGVVEDQIYYSMFCRRKCYYEVNHGTHTRQVLRSSTYLFDAHWHSTRKCRMNCRNFIWDGEKYKCLNNQMISVERMKELVKL